MAARVLAGRYELIGKIGEGGMAVVFRAKDRLLSRNVAIKILRPEFTSDNKFVDSFRRESQLAASIVDPNIVNVYDVGREGNIYYIVMELVEGEPLSEIIKREAPLDPRRAANITRQIAMALSTAHKHQLIHRDVKPHNVIISAGDVAKISDFGIAQKIVPEEADTGVKKQTVMGSIHYFSPEQARGAYVDERSDIYSLGIVLYEMLTGKVPFDGETPVDVALKHMNQPMIPPSKLNPDIPQDLEDIVMKATAKLQKDRYGSADEMITDLSFVKFSRQAGSGKKNETEEKSPEETPEERKARLRAERQAEKRRKLIKAGIIAAVVLALMLTGIGIVSHILNKDKQEYKIIDTPYVVGQSFDEAKQYLKQFLLELEVDMQVSSNEPAGTILSQSPREDTTIKQGQTIKVTISLGPSTAAVPMLVGETEKNAKAMLESYGYKVGETTGGYSDEYAKGYVMAQDPSAGTPLDKGQTVNIVVSLGPESGPPEIRTVTVPKLTQKTLAEAQRAIDDAGLSIGTITEQESSSVAEGCVISQSIGAGSKVDAGTEINIIVSLGAPKKDNSAENTAPGGTGD
ncbi:MAG: Stk1 family PASTA domain-containing Ser/Thr kinase [Firmicutes bacterium]|nr:Stk1 family PASTA domain-containing Ser/Thr kinase [Bacillota bacterium]